MTALQGADGCALTGGARKGFCSFSSSAPFHSAADCSSNLSPKQLSVLQVPTDPTPRKKRTEDRDRLCSTAENIRSFFYLLAFGGFIVWFLPLPMFF